MFECILRRPLILRLKDHFVTVAFVTEGSSWGSDASDAGEEPENQREVQPLVVGRGTAHKHTQHTSRYFSSSHTLMVLQSLYLRFILSIGEWGSALSGSLNTLLNPPQCLTLCRLCKYVCLPLRVSIVLSCLYLNFPDPVPCDVTADSHPALLSPFMSPLLFSNFPFLSVSRSLFFSLPLALGCLFFLFLCHCPFTFLVQVLLSRLSSIHSTLLDWSTCKVLSVSTADTEWPLNVNIIALCLLGS